MICAGNGCLPQHGIHDYLTGVLMEEEQFFLSCHHRLPVGRESEDVVDNAFDRLCRLQPLSYTEVADAYREMRCRFA